MLETQMNQKAMEIGVAQVDITPSKPMRLSGYAARVTTKATAVMDRLWAKALAFGDDVQGPSIFITVDLLGLKWSVVKQVVDRIARKTGIGEAQVVIAASHTHGGPETGNLMNALQCRGNYPTDFHFCDALLDLDDLVTMAEYNEQLIDRLEEVAMAALLDRRPAFVSWGQGTASFGVNRISEGGPVDNALPVLRVANPDGSLRAVLLNYATHGITYGPDVNAFHNDWMGEAQRQLAARYPGAVVLIAIGCAGDSHPVRQGKAEYVKEYGQEIAANVASLLDAPLKPLDVPPVGKMVWLKLPLAEVPSVPELIDRAKADTTIKGYYARLALERLQRGEQLPLALDFPIQRWAFGDSLVMINMGSEVVAEYAMQLKSGVVGSKLWINTYANDVSYYVASKDQIRVGGYEADVSMYWYNQPSPFAEAVEEIVLQGVSKLISP